MTGKYFLDTNFLVYCFSEDEPEKRKACLSVLQKGSSKVNFVLSTQVVKEFTAVMLNKFKQPPLHVKAIINDLAFFEVVKIDVDMIKEAIDIHITHQLSFWDSLIISSAKSAHCHTILTEDMNNGAILSGVKIENPFL